MHGTTRTLIATLVAVLSCTSDKVTAPAPVNVAAYTIAVAPAASTLDIDQHVALLATVRDTSGSAVAAASIAWGSDDTTIVSVDGQGTVIAVGPGTTQVRARSNGASEAAAVTVTGIPQNGLVAYYPFDGNANDASGKASNGVVTGATLVADRFGFPGRAYYFDGVSASIATTTRRFASANQLTVSTWVNWPLGQHGAYFVICNDFGLATGTFSTGMASQVGMAIFLPTTNSAIGNTQAAGWVHFVGTYDGQTIRAYINGQLIGQTPWPGTIPEIAALPSLTFGQFGSQYWSGTLDDFRVYNRVLQAGAIQQLYHERGWPQTADTSTAPAIARIGIDQQASFDGTIKLDVNRPAPLTVTAYDANNNPLTGFTAAWTSSNPSVATVSATGVVTGITQGTATIRATVAGKTDARVVQIVVLNLTTFQLTINAADDAGAPVSGAAVQDMSYGDRPDGCWPCWVPYGNSGGGSTNAAGSFTGSFVASSEAEDQFNGSAPHTFAYIVVSSPNYETDRRFVVGVPPAVTQAVHLHTMAQIVAGDSVGVTVASTDPVFQDLDTEPASFPTFVCRTIRVRAMTGGLLTVGGSAIQGGVAAPTIEIDLADESDFLNFGTGTTSTLVQAGDVVEVRIGAFINPGGSSQSFMLRTSVAPAGGAVRR